MSIDTELRISGKSPLRATTCPERLSEVVIDGSSIVAIPHRPPECMLSRSSPPPCMLFTVASIGSHVVLEPFSILRPGPMMISSPMSKFPSMILPPMTPPRSFVGRVPGLLMSNERATCMIERLCCERSGVGMVFSMASMRISKLTSWCAETGMTGAFSAMVPLRNSFTSA